MYVPKYELLTGNASAPSSELLTGHASAPSSHLCQCLKFTLCCTCASFCTLVIAAFGLYHVLTADSFTSSMPRTTELCRDVEQDVCKAEASMGLCYLGNCNASCTDCVRFDNGNFGHVTIPAEAAPEELAYGRTGSAIPESLQGIWWMDQYGYNVEAAGPDYPFAFTAAGETLITFGDDAIWQPDTQCVTPVYFYSGTRGHWAGMNWGNGTTCCGTNEVARLALSFCFTNDTQQEIDIWMKIYVGAGVEYFALKALGFIPAEDGYMYIPKGLIHLTMIKKPWGWDRESNAFGSWTRNISDTQKRELEAWLPGSIWKMLKYSLEAAEFTQHYPVFQVVDGDGKTTKQWEKWMEFVNNDTYSKVPGTIVVARRLPDP